MSAVVCLDCGRTIQLGNGVEEGDAVTCPNCEAEFELVTLEPPIIEWLYEGFDNRQGDESWDAAEGEEEEDDDDLVEHDDDKDWSWMIAKQRRLHEHPDARRKSQPTYYD